MPIYIGTMKAHTTPEVAKLAGVHLRTLHRWLERGLLPEPKRGKIGGLAVRIWTNADIERARKIKGTMKRGRKPAKKK
jgi:DNA-binding transcriptional MerR regulator